jgi:Dehydrogenases with different specificities (related to short-chain alcohol dehydrogenases)
VSSGLGQPLARELCTDFQVVGTYHSTEPDFSGLPITLTQLDVTSEVSVANFIAEIDREKSHRIALVNLAGISVDRLVVEMDLHEWEAVIRVNLTGAFLLSKMLVRQMMRARWGRFIFATSAVTKLGVPGTAAYSASKAGLSGLSKVLSQEYGRYNITANCLQLGYFAAGLGSNLTDDRKQALKQRIPARRLGDPSELANAVRFLVDASYCSGTELSIDGGLV